MKLLLKFRQILYDFNGSPRKVRPRGIAVTENTIKVAVKTSLSSKKNRSFYSPLFPKRQI